jgi:CHAT domain-containing protein/lipopolysaccharide biosynthesis regulator YciM
MRTRFFWYGFMLVSGFVLLITSCTTPSIVATRSIQLGDAMNNANKYDEAIRHYEEYMAIAPQLGLYRNPTMEADVCRKLAHAYTTQGNNQKAETYLGRAISLDTSPINTVGLIEDHRMFGMLRAYSGDYRGAIENFNKSLALSDGLERSLKDSKKLTIANTYLALSQVHLSLGNYKESEDFSKRALAFFSSIPQEFAGTVEAKLVLGILYRERNNLAEATAFCLESKQLAYSHQLNTSRQDQALGDINFLKGDFEEGIRYKLLAIEQAEKSNIKPQLVIATMRMGDAYRQLGDEKKANSYYQRAMQIQSQLEGNTANAGITQSFILRSGDASKAYDYYMQSGSAMGAALVCLRLGTMQLQQNDIDSAGIMLIKAKSYFEEIGHREGTAKVNLELAKVLTRKQAWTDAENLLAEAKELTVQQDLLWQIFFRRGILFEEKNQYDSAYAQYLESINIINAMRGNLTLEEFKTIFANTKVEVYDRMIMLLLNHAGKIGRVKPGKALELAFLYNEESRSRAFLDMLGNRKIDAKAASDEVLLEQEQLTRLKIQRLTNELHNASKPDKSSITLQAELGKTQEEYDRLLQRIKLNNPAYSSMISVNPVPVKDVQKILGSNTIALEYWVSREQVVLWLVTQNGIQVEQIPVKMSDLKKEIALARTAISYHFTEQRDASLKKLYTWLIAPVRAKLNAYSELVIIPHSNLHVLPFHALMDHREKFLVEEFVIQYAPSASVLFYCANRPVPSGNSFLGLALGNLALGEYAALPGTEVEVNHVSRLYTNTDIKTNEAFSETYLKDNIGSHGYVHLATHGTFNSRQPLYSYLLMAPTGDNDGRLTVEEIFGLTVQSKVVTLSACETGLGELSEGDELTGLSRAFIYAGAPGVIVSLWKVDDATTAWLMVRFYQYVQGGFNLSESLTFAQRDLIQRNFTGQRSRGLKEIEYDEEISQVAHLRGNASSRSPYYWAPFILIGYGKVR